MADINQENGEIPFEYEVVSPKSGQQNPPANDTPAFDYDVTQKAPSNFMDTSKDVVKSLGAGALRGTAGLADLPGDLTQLASAGSKYLTGYETPKFDTQFREGMSDLTGGYSERKPETTAGRYAGTVGEFIPGVIGATLTGGGSLGAQALRAGANIAKGAVLPGIASEALGQYTEGSDKPWLEPAARIAGAMLGGLAANKLENSLRGVISPAGGANATTLAEAKRLRELGIPVSAGQATKNAGIMGAEADTAAGRAIFGAAPDSAQAKAFTGASMRHIGSDADLATPEAMDAAKTAIVNNLNNSVAGVQVNPTLKMIDDVSEAKNYYQVMTPKDALPPLFDNIVSRMSSGQPMKAEELVSWRSNLGDLLSSGNDGVRGGAFRLRAAIDDVIENSLKAKGEPERFAQWKLARTQYRNYLAIRDAVKVTKQTGVNGIITPKELMAALARQSKDEIVTGRRGGMGELATLGVKNLTPLPSQGGSGFLRSATQAAGPVAASAAAGWGALQGAQFMGLNPLMTALGTGAAVAAPLVGAAKQGLRGTAMNPLVQKYLQNQLVNSVGNSSNIGSALSAARSALPSALDSREGRKSGGRVSSHDAAANQLVLAAERAKKGWSAQTEPLLNQSDETVVKALEVANRSI